MGYTFYMDLFSKKCNPDEDVGEMGRRISPRFGSMARAQLL